MVPRGMSSAYRKGQRPRAAHPLSPPRGDINIQTHPPFSLLNLVLKRSFRFKIPKWFQLRLGSLRFRHKNNDTHTHTHTHKFQVFHSSLLSFSVEFHTLNCHKGSLHLICLFFLSLVKFSVLNPKAFKYLGTGIETMIQIQICSFPSESIWPQIPINCLPLRLKQYSTNVNKT